MRSCLSACGLLCLIFSSAIAQPYRGGSNFIRWTSNPSPFLYTPDNQLEYVSHVESYYTISTYHQNQALIDGLITQLVENGQQRLRLLIFHRQDGTRCPNWPMNFETNMDSTGGDLSSQCKQNLINLLASMKSRGIQEVAVAFGPQGLNNPYGYGGDCKGAWPANWWYKQPYESYYQENWNLIVNLAPILQSSGLNIKIDLLNEGILGSSGSCYQGGLDYARRLWVDYNIVFPKDTTFGFSVHPQTDYIKSFDYVYGGNKPYILDVHLYPGGGPFTGDVPYNVAYQAYVDMYNALANAGYNLPWIIGETWYNSQNTAAAFQNARRDIGNTVWWLAEWSIQADWWWHEPPTDFAAYINNGW